AGAQPHAAVGARLDLGRIGAEGDVTVRRVHQRRSTLAARLARKASTRCFASGSDCVIAAISDSVISPWLIGCSAISGSAHMIAKLDISALPAMRCASS